MRPSTVHLSSVTCFASAHGSVCLRCSSRQAPNPEHLHSHGLPGLYEFLSVLTISLIRHPQNELISRYSRSNVGVERNVNITANREIGFEVESPYHLCSSGCWLPSPHNHSVSSCLVIHVYLASRKVKIWMRVFFQGEVAQQRDVTRSLAANCRN